MKQRWFNYRPLFLIFAFLCLGSVFSFYIFEGTLQLVLTILFVVSILVILIVIAVRKKKPKYAIIPLIAFLLGIGMYFIGVANFNHRVDYTPETISARVYNVYNTTDGRITLHTDSVKFNDNKIKDNLIIYVYDKSGLFEDLEIGAEITFKPTGFYKTELTYDGSTPNSKFYRNRLKYSSTAFIENLTVTGKDTTLAEKIKQKVHDNLDGVLSNENVELAYSALFGDKAMLYTDTSISFQTSGVAHIIAVSGLHVAIITGVVLAILKLFHVKSNWAKLIITAIFLSFYCYICGFAVSVVRASIMAVCLLFAKIAKREYDPLSAISLAGIILFTVDPFIIFDVGFLMSFSCVLGIVMLYKPIKAALMRTKMPNWLAEALALSISTMVSLIFVMAYYFKTFNAVSLLANIVIIPIFTFAYTILFVVQMFSLILPFLKWIAMPLNPIFDFIRLSSSFFANLKWANFSTIGFQFVVILIYFVLLLIISRICISKKSYRVIMTLPIVAILLLFLI